MRNGSDSKAKILDLYEKNPSLGMEIYARMARLGRNTVSSKLREMREEGVIVGDLILTDEVEITGRMLYTVLICPEVGRMGELKRRLYEGNLFRYMAHTTREGKAVLMAVGYGNTSSFQEKVDAILGEKGMVRSYEILPWNGVMPTKRQEDFSKRFLYRIAKEPV